VRLFEELRLAAGQLSHDPGLFIREVVSWDAADRKRRRLMVAGLACGLVAHVALLVIMAVAGWYRVLEPIQPKEPELELKSWVPGDVGLDSTHQAESPKSDGSGKDSTLGGGQNSPRPETKGWVPPRAPLPPVVAIDPSTRDDPTLTVLPTIQDPDAPPPPPGAQLGDPKAPAGDPSGGTGSGGGIGSGKGGSVGSREGSGGRPGGSGGPGGGDAKGPGGGASGVKEVYFGGPSPPGYVPITWVRQVTAITTPEAQANKVSGEVLLRATFNADATITDIEVVRTVPYMTESAIEALKRCRFRPATVNGVPITVRGVIVRIRVIAERG
jgi:TonB family protein